VEKPENGHSGGVFSEEMVFSSPAEANDVVSPSFSALERSESALRERRARILRERAILLAREPKQLVSTGDVLDVVVFRLADEVYALESTCVGEVFPLRNLVPVPGTPSFVAGIVTLRGQILSVLDLRVLFGLPRRDPAGMVLFLRSAEMELGVLADVLLGVRTLLREEIRPAPPSLPGPRAAYLKGVLGEDLILLDGRALLRDRSLVVEEASPE
jgi:purine-binding chemotaxis protein CheW